MFTVVSLIAGRTLYQLSVHMEQQSTFSFLVLISFLVTHADLRSLFLLRFLRGLSWYQLTGQIKVWRYWIWPKMQLLATLISSQFQMLRKETTGLKSVSLLTHSTQNFVRQCCRMCENLINEKTRGVVWPWLGGCLEKHQSMLLCEGLFINYNFTILKVYSNTVLGFPRQLRNCNCNFNLKGLDFYSGSLNFADCGLI